MQTQFGQITSISYKQGFAFIDYADQRDAEDAIQSMNGKQLGNRTITVELSGRPPRGDKPGGGPPGRDDDMRSDTRGGFGGYGGNSRSHGSSDIATRNLFVANIPETLSEDDVMHHFGKFGQVQTVKFLPQKSDTRAAFVDFQNVEDAREAHSNPIVINGSKLRTDYNRRGESGGKGGGAPPGGGGYGYDRGYDRGPPPPRYDDRGPPPRYEERRYDERPPPQPRYEERRYNDRGPPRYDDRYDQPPRYPDDRRYDDRRPAYGERERDYPSARYDERPPPRFDDRRYDDRRCAHTTCPWAKRSCSRPRGRLLLLL